MGSSTHRGRRASFGLVPDPVWQSPEVLVTPERRTVAGAPRVSRTVGGVAYASSKLALVTLAHEWADRLAASGRRLNVYDPGLVAGTGLGRDMRPHEYWAWRKVMPVMSVLPGATTPRRTARHLVALALGEDHPDLHDGYVEMGRVTHAEPVTFDPARRQALWDWCEQASRRGADAQGGVMLTVSLALNVLVLVPVITGLLRDSGWAARGVRATVASPRHPHGGVRGDPDRLQPAPGRRARRSRGCGRPRCRAADDAGGLQGPQPA